MADLGDIDLAKVAKIPTEDLVKIASGNIVPGSILEAMVVEAGLIARPERLKPERKKGDLERRWESGRKRRGIEELLVCPGIVGDMAAWINRAAIKPQPILSLGATLAACGTILGQRVQTRTGLRTNLYCLGVSDTGSGKEAARGCVRSLFDAIARPEMVGSSFASGAAVEAGLRASPICLYLVDEIGHLFASLKNQDTPAYIHDIVPALLTVYGESGGSHRCRTYGDARRNEGAVIYGPCLSLYGTTVPGNFYRSVTKEQLSNGLLSRFLVFESRDPDPWHQSPCREDREVPEDLMAWAAYWLKAGGDISPEPIEILASTGAQEAFDALELELRYRREDARARGDDQGPYTRVEATAEKLALIRACGCLHQAISTDDALWACDLAWELVTMFAERVLGDVSENRVEDERKRVHRIIRDAGVEGLTRESLAKRTKWLRSKDLTDICGALSEAGEIELCKVQTGGRPALLYRVA